MRPEFAHLKNKLYYSQNREDLILEAFFPNLRNGFYVDVGAYDPDYDSVTKLFYKKGWRGINIEPQPERYRRFVRKRPRDINLNNGVSSTGGEAELAVYDNGGLSTFSKDLKEEYAHEDGGTVSKVADIKVEMKTLESIFDEYGVKKIDFIKIDVEGLELEVLKSNNWTKYRPDVICIEANHITKDWRKYVLSVDYHLAFFDGLNEYYASSEEILQGFDYVAHIITKRGGGIAFRDYHAMQGMYKGLENELKRTDDERQAIQLELQKARKRLQEVDGELHSPRFLAARFVHVILSRIREGGVK